MLVIEDEALVALDLLEALQQPNAVVVRSVDNVENALKMIST